MKELPISIYVVLSLVFTTSLADAQTSPKKKGGVGFDYASHNKMNAKAGKWSKRRIKAADGDQTSIQCSVRKSRKHRRKMNS